MSNCCNYDPCCSGCKPARYDCMFDIQVSPYDPWTWLFTWNGMTKKIKVPGLDMTETDTHLKIDNSGATLTYNAEKHTDVITGEQLGGIIRVEDLRDTDTANADSCDLFVFDPYCSSCGDGCRPASARWRNYHIPDAGECVMEVDNDGYYKVLIKDDCGCIKECRLPVMPEGSTTINYVRDSVPDDPDYPFYYGAYNDRINLYLAQNAPQWFGKYDLEITVNYGIQVFHSTASPNTNFRSLMVPVVADSAVDVSHFSSILQNQSTVLLTSPYIPWGTISMRGSFQFIAPKGKEVYLHHEFRLRGAPHPDQYLTNPLDGQRVPDDVASHIDRGLYTMSRLNALQVIVKPTRGIARLNPTVDPERSQLDPAVDEYPNVS